MMSYLKPIKASMNCWQVWEALWTMMIRTYSSLMTKKKKSRVMMITIMMNKLNPLWMSCKFGGRGMNRVHTSLGTMIGRVNSINGLRSMLRLYHRKLPSVVLIRMPPALLYSLKDLLIAAKRKNSGVRFVLKQKLSYSWRIIANMLKRSCNHLMIHPVKLTKRNKQCQSCRQFSPCHLNASYKRSWIWVHYVLSSMITHPVLNAMPSSRSTLLSSLRD
mmetsp:Transcript_11223/g.18541  ORF Transcript_11223/g.18541 Transcript_11223/m.18541 type:complete len:218 (+) Transcript_11223:1288-1941(+)